MLRPHPTPSLINKVMYNVYKMTSKTEGFNFTFNHNTAKGSHENFSNYRLIGY